MDFVTKQTIDFIMITFGIEFIIIEMRHSNTLSQSNKIRKKYYERERTR